MFDFSWSQLHKDLCLHFQTVWQKSIASFSNLSITLKSDLAPWPTIVTSTNLVIELAAAGDWSFAHLSVWFVISWLSFASELPRQPDRGKQIQAKLLSHVN